MGANVSSARLSGEVGRHGGLGIISSVGLDLFVTRRTGRPHEMQAAVAAEVEYTRSLGGPCGINIMCVLVRDYEAAVRGALDGGVDFIFSGAGLPLHLPALVKSHAPNSKTGLVPIISSARALHLVCRRWERLGARPVAAVLEGPLAGGHLGWKTVEEIAAPENSLENLLPPVLEVAAEFGGFPILVAGGVYTHADIARWVKAGAAGVQMATRFLATEESGASDAFKRAVVAAKPEDVIVAVAPGSPCGYPIRILRQSPLWQEFLAEPQRPPVCDLGYVLRDGGCMARDDLGSAFCICHGLLAASDYHPDTEPPIWTVGANASRVDRILAVEALMRELAG